MKKCCPSPHQGHGWACSVCKDLGEGRETLSIHSGVRRDPGGVEPSACEVEDGCEACAAGERTLPKFSRRGQVLFL